MTTPFQITIDDKPVEVRPGQTLYAVCKQAGIDIPVLCQFDGLSKVGACRLCLVELEGTPKLLPACTTTVAPGQKIKTNTEKLQKYRRMTMELYFAERNHICAVCVANNNCELQDLATKVGMDHVRFPYLLQDLRLDATHEKFIIDQNRCVLCTRCVRVCDEVEGAHNWDVMSRGFHARVIADFNQPWGESTTCTSCGKCLQVCPTGALWPKDASISRLVRTPEMITDLIRKKEALK